MIQLSFVIKKFLIFRPYPALRVKNKLSMSLNLERFSDYLRGDWNNKNQSMKFPALWSHIHVDKASVLPCRLRSKLEESDACNW